MLQVNEYFDGRVKSIAFQSGELPETVGVLESGDYEFSTAEKETMTVISGTLSVQLPHAPEYQEYHKGEQFIVEAHNTFKMKVDGQTAYLCRYG